MNVCVFGRTLRKVRKDTHQIINAVHFKRVRLDTEKINSVLHSSVLPGWLQGTECLWSPNSHVEIIIPNVMILGGGGSLRSD